MILPIDAAALFMLGLLGSGHCIGMCGPLVVALPGRIGRPAAHLAYHAGRLLAYTIIGAIMGAAGGGLIQLAAVVGGSPMVWIGRVQVGISLLASLFLLFFGLSRLGLMAEPRWMRIADPGRLPGWRRFFPPTAGRFAILDLFVVGVMLGGLPCGLSYAAFSKALAEARVLPGALAALIFGLGTLPGLLAVGAGAAVFLRRFQPLTEILSGLIMLGMAAHLLLDVVEGVWG